MIFNDSPPPEENPNDSRTANELVQNIILELRNGLQDSESPRRPGKVKLVYIHIESPGRYNPKDPASIVKDVVVRVGGPKKSVAMVGRSSQPKFTERGISIPSDPELSISHGRFISFGDVVAFQDLGSTNHTLVTSVGTAETTELMSWMVLPIKIGDHLLLGGTSLTIVDIKVEGVPLPA